MLNEAEIIKRLQGSVMAAPDVVGIGDDAAVVPINSSESYVISKDLLVENRHFRLTTTTATELAVKSLHVNLSDVAAMGATPFYVLLGLALPSTLDETWVKDFTTAFASACAKQKTLLIGGDTTASDRDLFISVTAVGRVDNRHLKFRTGAKKGDVVAVAGALGEAEAGLVALEKNVSGLADVKRRSVEPRARIAEGEWLGRQESVTAMMDVSDGLYIDLERLCKASSIGATIEMENIKPSKVLQDASERLQLDPRAAMLTGGEDYALLFTVKEKAFDELATAFLNSFGYPLTNIGKMTGDSGTQLSEGSQTIPFMYRSFSHFGEL